MDRFTILHLDKSAVLLKAIGKVLDTQEIEYISCENSQSAAASVLFSRRVHLIITSSVFEDTTLPEFVSWLESECSQEIPLIVMTTNDTMAFRSKMFALGVADVLFKDADVIKRISAYIGRLKRQDEIIEALQSARIAALDDSPVQLKILRRIFELNGISAVDYYEDPFALLEQKDAYDVYIVDVILPGMTGEQMVVELRERHPNAIIMALSGVDNYKVISNLLLSGADDYVLKPYNSTIFISRIKANMRTFLLHRELQRAVITDGLTGLYNHKYTFDTLEGEIARARRYSMPLSCLMFDLDHFKSINDTYGHQVGDVVLKEVSATLKRACREIDVVGRYGGEEFFIVLPETKLKGALVLAERIRSKIESLSFDQMERNVTISGGVAEWEDHTATELVNKVDELLYVSKGSGRNRISSES